MSAKLLPYRPAVTRSRAVGRFRLGGYVAMLLVDVEPRGGISYDYLLEVCDAGRQLALVVSAERSSLGTRCVGVFHGEGHANYPEDVRFEYAGAFATRALELAGEWLKISERPQTEWLELDANEAPAVAQADLPPLVRPRGVHGGI